MMRFSEARKTIMLRSFTLKCYSALSFWRIS